MAERSGGDWRRRSVAERIQGWEARDVKLRNVSKDFHGTERVGKVKQAAYTIKWIAKLRPVQFSCSEDVVSKPLLYVNEVFAMRGRMAFMRISPDVLPELLYDDMLYTLRYRHIDERMLIVWLSTLQHALDGDIPHTDIQV